MEKINKILIFIGIYVLIVVTGVFAIVDFWQSQGLTSVVHGVLNIHTNDSEDDSYNFILTGFKETTDGKYSFSQTVLTDMTDLNNFAIKINSIYCETKATKDTMFSSYCLAFKNYENNIILSDTLNVSVALHSGKLNFIFVTSNENAVPYWNKHFKANGFTVELVESKTFEIEPPIINELEPILYWEYNGEKKSVLVENNTIDMKIVLNNALEVETPFYSPSIVDDIGFNSILYINDIPLIDNRGSMTKRFNKENLTYYVTGYSLSLNSKNFETIFPNSNLEFTEILEGTKSINGEVVDTYWGMFLRYTNSNSYDYTGFKIQGFEEPLTINLTWEINYYEK